MTKDGHEMEGMMASGKKPEIVAGMDNPVTNDHKQHKTVTRFREVLPQVLATMACNMVGLEVIVTLAFSTVAIAQMHRAEAQPHDLSLDDVQASWIASIPFICQPVGSVVSGLLVQLMGRKRSLMLVNVPFLVGWLLMYTAHSFEQLAVAQVILGVTIGLCEAPLNTYYGEISQPELRGILAGTAGTTYQTGFFLEYLLGKVTNWRTVVIMNAVLPVITVLYFSQVPESPIWLLSKGRKRDAQNALCWLRGWVKPNAVKEEFSQLVRYSEEAKKEIELRTPDEEERPEANTLLDWTHREHVTAKRRWKCLGLARDVLRPPTLRPLSLVVPFFFFVHWTAMTAIRPYMVHVFEGFKVPIDPMWATVGSAGIGILGSLCLLLLVHSTGKRPLSLCCIAVCSVACVLLGLFAFLVPAEPAPAVRWLPLVLFVLLTFAQSIVSQVPWMLLCEVFPYRTRGFSSGIAAAGCYVFLFLASKTYLDIERGLLLHGAFWFYGVASGIGFLFLYFRLLETEGKTLGEIEHHFTHGLSARASK